MSYGLRMSLIQNWSNRLYLHQQRVWQWWKFIRVHHKPIIKQLGYRSSLTLTYPRLSSILASRHNHLELMLCCLPMRLWHTPWRRRRNVSDFWFIIKFWCVFCILFQCKMFICNGHNIYTWVSKVTVRNYS